MVLTVETGYLRGYASQIDANRTGALAALRTYCTTHCGNTDGLGGLLAPARVAVDLNTGWLQDLVDGGDRGLWLTANDLRLAADDYDRSDGAAADRMWTTGRTWELPKDYHEQDVSAVSSGFSGGAMVNLAVPRERHDAESAKDSVYQLLGTVNGKVQAITGRDLLGEAMPIVFGEWGILRRIAEAHDEMERGFDRIAQDLADGMDALSAHWTSDASGASAAFDYHMRERWIKGFRALANYSGSMQQTYEWMADAYEYIVNAFLLALNFYAQRIKKAIAGLVTTNLKKALWNLYQLVSTVFQLIADTTRMIVKQTKLFASSIEMMGSGLQYLLNTFRGDFAVFNQA